MAERNSHERLKSHLGQLRRHLLKCYDCRGALATGLNGRLCVTGALLVLESAREFNGVLELRRKANALGEGVIHACPDLSKHGEAYALTAIPFHVTGVQGELF